MNTDVEPSVQAWVDKIRPHLTQAIESIVATGRDLIAAKEELPHGSFGPLLDELGLSPRVAQRFMRIAEHPVIANATPESLLPAALSVLDELARLTENELTEALESGEVTPSTTRVAAKAITKARGKSKGTGKTKRPSRSRATVKKAVETNRSTDRSTGALQYATNIIAKAASDRVAHGVKDPAAEAEALDRLDQAVAAFRASTEVDS